MENIEAKLTDIRAELDLSRRNLLTAVLVTEAFREVGVDPVIVGGSAIEIYTDGQYVSGDVDICFAGAVIPTPEQRASVMSQIGRPFGRASDCRRWDVGGILVEILGAWRPLPGRSSSKSVR